MPSEIELKLELAPEALEKLLTSDLLGAPDETLNQRSTYFDTADWTLFARGSHFVSAKRAIPISRR
nr:CYTH domain-containing protein [Rhizobium laguerreae]